MLAPQNQGRHPMRFIYIGRRHDGKGGLSAAFLTYGDERQPRDARRERQHWAMFPHRAIAKRLRLSVGAVYAVQELQEKPGTYIFDQREPVARLTDAHEVAEWSLTDSAEARAASALRNNLRNDSVAAALLPVRDAYTKASPSARPQLLAYVVAYITAGVPR